MAYVTYHIEKVARISRVVAVISLVEFIVALIVNVAIGINNPRYLHEFGKPIIALWCVVSLVPAIFLWVGGTVVRAGKFWGFTLILVGVPIEFLKLITIRLVVGGCIGIVWRLPTMYLIAYFLNALPDMRDHFRKWRRRNQPRGFEPIMTSAPLRPVPPPPARNIPPRRR